MQFFLPKKIIASKFTFLASISLIAVLTGLVIPVFLPLFSGKYYALLAVPLAFVLAIALFLNPLQAFYVILVIRSSIDLLLDKTKIGPIGLGAVLNLVVIIIALMQMFSLKQRLPSIFIKGFIPFIVMVGVSIFYSPDKFMALKTYVAVLSYAAVFYLGVILIKSHDDFKKWLLAIFLSAIIPVLYSAVNILKGGYIGANTEFEGFRVNSTFSHPNVFAFYLVAIVTLSFMVFKYKTELIISPNKKLFIPFLILILLALLFTTKTRSAWATTVFFFLTYGSLMERKYILYMGGAFIAALFIPEIRDRILDLTTGNEVINYSRLNSFAWRKLIWFDGLHWMEPSRYIFGYGTDAFRSYSPLFFSMSGGAMFGAHNVFVQLLFDTGIIGLMTFIWIFVMLVYRAFKRFWSNKLFLMVFCMLIVEYLLESYSDNMLAYLAFNWYFWFVVGAMYSYGSITYAKKVDSTL